MKKLVLFFIALFPLCSSPAAAVRRGVVTAIRGSVRSYHAQPRYAHHPDIQKWGHYHETSPFIKRYQDKRFYKDEPAWDVAMIIYDRIVSDVFEPLYPVAYIVNLERIRAYRKQPIAEQYAFDKELEEALRLVFKSYPRMTIAELHKLAEAAIANPHNICKAVIDKIATLRTA